MNSKNLEILRLTRKKLSQKDRENRVQALEGLIEHYKAKTEKAAKKVLTFQALLAQARKEDMRAHTKERG